MSQVYGWCLVCANAQKDLDTCALCGSGYVIARDVVDYEIHLFDLDVISNDVDPQTYSTKNDGHERPGDGPKDPGKAIPAPVGGSMENTVVIEQDAAFMDPYDNAFWESEETDLLVKSERKTKTVGGKHLTAENFACVGDPQRTETWKLPIHDANHVRNALARFSQAEGCNTPAVRAKILRAAKRFGVDAQSLDKQHKAYYQDNVKKHTQDTPHTDPGPIGSPVPVVTDVAPPEVPEVESVPDPDLEDPDATQTGKKVPPTEDPDATQTSEKADCLEPDANVPVKVAEQPVEAAVPEKLEAEKVEVPVAEAPAMVEDNLKNEKDKNQTSVEDTKTTTSAITPKKIADDQAKQARKTAIAKMQVYLKPSDNYLAPKKKGNVDLLPNLGKEVKTSTTKAAGVPTTRTPQGDNINDHHIEITDQDGAPTRTVPTADILNTQHGVVTPQVRTDENHTVVLKDGDSFVGDGDKPGDSTTRGPDADRVDTNGTVVIKDVTKTKDVVMAIKTLRFAKTFWKSSEGVLAFLINEGFWPGYQVDASGKIVNQIRDTGGYFEVDALPADKFKAGNLVDQCIASFGGDCAIIATMGEILGTVAPNFLPGDQVKSLAVPGPITKSFAEHHIKRVAFLESESLKTSQELDGVKTKLAETETLLATALKDKNKLIADFVTVKAELSEKIAEAKLAARLEDLPSVIRAQLRRNSHTKDDLIQFLRTANDQEWELARRTFALAKHQSFTELSEEEGKLPVGGGSTNETKTLQEYLR